MRTLIYTAFVSLDGVVDSPGGGSRSEAHRSGGWTYKDVEKLKETDGGPIVIHGSATLARNLSDAGLIDRYHLLVFPVLLGAGKRMFSDTDKDKQMLKVVESETYANGITKLVYDVVH